MLRTVTRFDPAWLVVAGLVLAVGVTPAIFAPGLYDDFTLPKQATLLVAAACIAAALAGRPAALPLAPLVLVLGGAWLVWTVITTTLGVDGRASVLGYYQYRQGLLSQWTYAALAVGGAVAASRGLTGIVAACGLAGFAGTVAYAGLQAFNADPLDWWLDSSDRVIGTIGNANELAAYVLVAGGLAALALPARLAGPALGVLGGGAAFCVLEAQSRSGLAASLVSLAVLGALTLAWPAARAQARQLAVPLTIGIAAGAGASWFAGGPAEVAAATPGPGAVSGTPLRLDSGSTRLALWEGTLAVIREHPVTGVGPDGLHLAFPRERPEGLGGAFGERDVIAQSAHNWPLDVAASTGIPGLALLTATIAAAIISGLRRRPRGCREALLLAALAGYGTITLFNPISLAAAGVAAMLLGMFAALPPAEPAETYRRTWAVPPLALAGAGIGGAVLLITADLHANSAWAAYARGDFQAAAGRYAEARIWMPLERDYAAREAEAWLAAAAQGTPGAAERAERRLERLGFERSASEALYLAMARIVLGRDPSAIEAAIAEMERKNPQGISTTTNAQVLRHAAAVGGRLGYHRDYRTVFIEPLGREPETVTTRGE